MGIGSDCGAAPAWLAPPRHPWIEHPIYGRKDCLGGFVNPMPSILVARSTIVASLAYCSTSKADAVIIVRRAQTVNQSMRSLHIHLSSTVPPRCRLVSIASFSQSRSAPFHSSIVKSFRRVANGIQTVQERHGVNASLDRSIENLQISRWQSRREVPLAYPSSSPASCYSK